MMRRDMTNEDIKYVYKREVPGTGLGVDVSGCKTTADVLKTAGLNWTVHTEKAFLNDGSEVPDARIVRRDLDGRQLGIVSPRYVPCQNEAAIAFTDNLINDGLEFLRAGSFRGGKSIWMMGKFQDRRNLFGDPIDQYIVITNSHDGSSSIRAAIIPIRIACSNALNMAFRKARFFWFCRHTGSLEGRLQEAQETLQLAGTYMDVFQEEMKNLNEIVLSPDQVKEHIIDLIPMPENPTKRIRDGINERRLELSDRFYHAEDLQDMPSTAYRFINAVSDYATHGKPKRKTSGYAETLFEKTVYGHPMLRDAMKKFA